MNDSVKKIAGNSHKSVVDPAGILGDDVDPIGVFDYGKTAEVAGAPALAMPDPDGDAVAAARRRKAAAMQQRGGRASTILGGEDRLGG
jgi:hypothetical protein